MSCRRPSCGFGCRGWRNGTPGAAGWPIFTWSGCGASRISILPAAPPWAEPVWHLFVIRTSRRAALQAYLAERGIGTMVHYPTPPHLSGAYRGAGGKPGDFPIAERLAAEVLSLPIGPHVTLDEVDFVCDSVRAFYGSS